MAVIEVDHLRKQYGATVAVADVSFAVEAGEIFGILGPNGAGKTTTVECIAGLRKPDAGDVAVRGRLGVQLQESALPDKITVREALDLFSSFYPEPADWRAVADDLGLSEKLKTRYGKLSGGQKQRLSIALALIGNPDIAILDELTTGLDPQARRDTWDLIESIRDRGVTVLLVTHFMEEAERLCDRLAVIDGGRIVALDSPAGLVARVSAEQRLRFRPSEPLGAGLLTALAEVREVRQHGTQIEVIGDGNVVHAVTALLARHGIIAADLRVEQASLDEAFVQLLRK
jgi:ABC-2 type transport system ATP-binding protein